MFTGVMMMTTADNSQSSHDEAIAQTAGIIDRVQRPPMPTMAPPPQLSQGPSREDHAYHQATSAPIYVTESDNDPFERNLQLGIQVAIALLAFALGIGACAAYLSYVQVSEAASERRMPPHDEKSTVDHREVGTDDKPVYHPKTMMAVNSSVPNLAASPEKRPIDSRKSDSQTASPIDLIAVRLVRLDDEFSRLKIDLADLKKSDELRRHDTVKGMAWTKAIATGQLTLRTSPDERNKHIITLVFVPAGQFWMGQTDAQRGESARTSSAAHYDFSYPAHPVQVKSGYFIGQYEVTVGQLQEFAAQKNSSDLSATINRYANEADRNKPACNIDWKTAMDFCGWLSEINNVDVRLPTEVEWEYAARGNMYIQHFESLREQDVVMGGPWAVDTPTLDRSWCGCVAMNSNVQEWTIDVWDEKVYGKRDAMLKSARPNSSFLYTGYESQTANARSEPRAVRGSSFQDIPANRVLAIRRFKATNAREETLGLRLVVPVASE